MRRGNVVSIKGNATKDVEIRKTQTGMNACSWCIAWNNSRKNKNDEWVDIPNFFDVECWASDNQVKFLEGIKKGTRCAIIGGHLEQRSWEKDGRKYSKVVIRVDDPVSGLMLETKQAETVTEFAYDIPF